MTNYQYIVVADHPGHEAPVYYGPFPTEQEAVEFADGCQEARVETLEEGL